MNYDLLFAAENIPVSMGYCFSVFYYGCITFKLKLNIKKSICY